MNRIYNNESIIILCIIRLLSEGTLDIAKLMLMVVFAVDDRIRAMVTHSDTADELFSNLQNDQLLNRKYISYGPYFLNSLIVLKQSGAISIEGTKIRFISNKFNGNMRTGSNRMTRVLHISDKVRTVLSEIDTLELYTKAGIQL